MIRIKIILFSAIIIASAISCQQEDEAFVKYPVELITPASEATDQPLDVMLEWQNPNPQNPSVDTYRYDVYLGTSPDDLQLVSADLGSDLDDPVFECGALEMNTDYFWKVRIKAQEEFIDSPINKFTTTDQLPSMTFENSRLIVYPADYVFELPDSVAYEVSLTPSGAISFTDGQGNTQILMDDYANYPHTGLYEIANYCDSLQAYGYDDWYLPSIVELDSLASHHLLSKLERNTYWSSTEDTQELFMAFALKIDGISSAYFRLNKYHESEYKCRCIRKD